MQTLKVLSYLFIFSFVCLFILLLFRKAPEENFLEKVIVTNEPSINAWITDRQSIEDAIRSDLEIGVAVKIFPGGKGRGVITTKPFLKDQFILEYRGELVSAAEGEERQNMYDRNPNITEGYSFFFEHKNRKYCVDATAETEYLGRLINHSVKRPNLDVSVLEVDGIPHLLFSATRYIAVGEELLFDYGERRMFILAMHPWLFKS